ncbi:MAG: phosphatidate cytidylyltransferase [Candidatus Cloacimonadales bacterium]|nr:phosphatidate cytidylyltransferase [Candidatus Cloacimonadales bacterium]
MIQKHKGEVFRKAIHFSLILLPLAYRYLVNYDKKITLFVLISLLFIALLVEILRMKHPTFKRIFFDVFGLMLRSREYHDFTSATYMLISVVICIAVLPPEIAFIAISFLAIGDTLAALVGVQFGKRKLFGTIKSLEGSLACFAGTFIFALFYLNPIIAFAGALAATLAEAAPIWLDDNIKVPITSGIVMMLVSYVVISGI